MRRKLPLPEAKKLLSKVPEHISFWICTNENLRSLSEISSSLGKADDDVFRYHVSRDKNDFEIWIREVLGDKDLAREIARVKTKETLLRKINERVDELRRIVKWSQLSRNRKKRRKKRRTPRRVMRKRKSGRKRKSRR